MDSIQFNALIKEAKKKDSRAIGVLYNYCVNVVKRRMQYKFGPNNDIEDWARNAVTYKILSNLPKNYIEAPVTYLYKVADSYVYTYMEKHTETEEYDDNLTADPQVDNLVNEIMVKDVLKKLDELTCRILVLSYYRGLNSVQIGEMLKMKPDAVRQRIRRGKIYFKKYVTE